GARLRMAPGAKQATGPTSTRSPMKPVQRTIGPGAFAAAPALLTLLLAAPAGAVEIYKCKQADGTIAYSSYPCGENTQQIERRRYDTPAPPQGTTWAEQAAQQ